MELVILFENIEVNMAYDRATLTGCVSTNSYYSCKMDLVILGGTPNLTQLVQWDI